MSEKDRLIAQLRLEPLVPEGGYFVQTWSSARVEREKQRPAPWGTAIYFLLTPETFSAFHRLQAEELWHFYAGDAVEHWQLRPQMPPVRTVMGPDLLGGHRPQLIVPANCWQAARTLPAQAQGWSLLGCTMCPGWRDELFQMADRAELIREFPDQEALVNSLARDN